MGTYHWGRVASRKGGCGGKVTAKGSIGLCVDQLDVTHVTTEVGCVECEKPVLSMREHGGYDVGVVDLASSNGDLATEGYQLLGHCGPVFQHNQSIVEPLYVIKRVR